MACPTCSGDGYLDGEPCPAPDCPDKPVTAVVSELRARIAKDVKVVNLAPNQDWSALPVIFDGDNS